MICKFWYKSKITIKKIVKIIWLLEKYHYNVYNSFISFPINHMAYEKLEPLCGDTKTEITTWVVQNTATVKQELIWYVFQGPEGFAGQKIYFNNNEDHDIIHATSNPQDQDIPNLTEETKTTTTVDTYTEAREAQKLLY